MMKTRSKHFVVGITLTGLLSVAISMTSAAFVTAAERLVLMEKFSASWCPHCAAASRDIDLLLENYPDQFVSFDAFAATSGRYTTDWGVSRAFDFYGVSAYPTVVFDGISGYVGSDNAYAAYEQLINMRASVPTDVGISVTALPAGGGLYNVTTTVSLESNGVAKSMRIYVIQALDNFGFYDDAASTVPLNTVKQVVETGYDMTLFPGQANQFTRSVELDSDSWGQFDDIRFIAWAQVPLSAGAAEVYNATQIPLWQAHPADFNRDGQIDSFDLLLWEDQFGASSLPFEGADGNGNGRVDGLDLLVWQRYYGLASNQISADATTAIPEPSTILLALGGGMRAIGWRRKRLPRPIG